MSDKAAAGADPAQGGSADDATRGSAIKLAAELLSRLLTLATTYLLMRGLGAAGFGVFNVLQASALLLAEVGELGLQNLTSRALVAGTASLRSLVRARLLAAALVTLVALAAIPLAPTLSGARAQSADTAGSLADGVALALLIGWFALSGWGEFLGLALRCRGRRVQEAVLLLALRGGALVLVPPVLASGGGLRLVCAALAVSPLPALVLGAVLLRRSSAPAAPSPSRREVLRESSPLAVHGALLLLSPRVELLVLGWLQRDAVEVGLFGAALTFYWFLAMIPSAVAAGAMPALTREAAAARAGHRQAPVRQRTSATLALLGTPAGAGLALVAAALTPLLGDKYTVEQQVAAAHVLQVLAAAVPALFLNALLAASLIAAARASWLPWLTASRVALAAVLAVGLVPRFGAIGAASGLVAAEWLLLAAGAFACARSGVAVDVARPLGAAIFACLPLAAVVWPVRGTLPLALAAGIVTWLATLALVAWLAPSFVRQVTGDFRYPWSP